jgi:hypothetical protein
MKTITNITYPAFALFALAYFALSPQARATCQDACLTNNNTVQGDDALIRLTTGTDNTAIGWSALFNNTTGNNNTATGSSALYSNTTGNYNTASGWEALFANEFGSRNTGNGYQALEFNRTGHDNTANGYQALIFNTLGNFNTAIGDVALSQNQTGSFNIALGFKAGAKTTGDGNIDIGNVGLAGEAGTIRIGATGTQANAYIAGISGVTVPGGIGVIVDSSGHLGTSTSSARFKDNIQPMDKASEAILVLKPVTFRYKHDLDPEGIPQFGLVAEDVEKVNPDLVARDDQGKPYSVRYEAVNAMLLNEFLKEHRKVEKLEATVAQQHKDFEAVVAELKGQIQRVSAQLEVNKMATRTVVANQ